MTAYLIVVSLARALFFTGLGISLFLVAFLGYFTVSFLFLGVGLALLAGSSANRRYRRLRNRTQR
jgi:hypothetical protein